MIAELVLLTWGLAAEAQAAIVIRTYADRLDGVCTARPDVRVSVGRNPSMPDERLLIVDYPAPTGDPAGRDVQCAAEHQDWTAGRAIEFQIKSAHPLRLSVSFLDRNHV